MPDRSIPNPPPATHRWRRASLRAVLALVPALAALLAPARAVAQEWPAARPLRIVIAFGAGSASDIYARMIAERLQKGLGQAVIVESRPGASGQIAAEAVARAPADGYTLFVTTNTTHSANPFLFRRLPYDPIRDFTPIARVGYFPFVLLVDAARPSRSVADLIAHAKANPGTVSYAYSSSAGQIPAAALAIATRMDAVGIAYKASPQALTDVAGGQATFTIVDLATSQPFVKSGPLRPLAVTPVERTSLAPDLPTLREAAGLADFGVTAWLGVFGPAGLPKPIVDRISAEVLALFAQDEVRQRMVAATGVEPAPAGPAEFEAFVRAQLDVWERQIRIAGVKPE